MKKIMIFIILNMIVSSFLKGRGRFVKNVVVPSLPIAMFYLYKKIKPALLGAYPQFEKNLELMEKEWLAKG